MSERPVVVGRKLCCPTCGCAGWHGCMGPSRQWQARLAGEIQRLREVLSAIERLPASSADLPYQIARDALKVDPE